MSTITKRPKPARGLPGYMKKDPRTGLAVAKAVPGIRAPAKVEPVQSANPPPLTEAEHAHYSAALTAARKSARANPAAPRTLAQVNAVIKRAREAMRAREAAAAHAH